MWILVIIAVVAVITRFAYDSHRQSLKVAKEGGMVNKYAMLASYILSADPRARITKQTSTSVDFCLSTADGATTFFLTQTFGSLTIQWKMNSPIFGIHKLEWDFREYFNQEKMIAKINNDLEKYQTNLTSVYGYPCSMT